jgi:hypothetical protein
MGGVRRLSVFPGTQIKRTTGEVLYNRPVEKQTFTLFVVATHRGKYKPHLDPTRSQDLSEFRQIPPAIGP